MRRGRSGTTCSSPRATSSAQGRITVTGIWSHFAASDEPEHPANDAQEAAFRDALALAASAGLDPEVRHLANSAAAILRPSARFDLVRCGIATYGLDPAPGRTPDLGLVPAMTVRGRLALVKHDRRRRRRLLRPHLGRRRGHHAGPGARRVRRRGAARSRQPRPRAGSAAGSVPIRGRVCMDQIIIDLDGDVPAAGDEVVVFGAGTRGEPTAQDWAEAADTISYEIVTRVGGRLVRRHVDSDEPTGAEQP